MLLTVTVVADLSVGCGDAGEETAVNAACSH